MKLYFVSEASQYAINRFHRGISTEGTIQDHVLNEKMRICPYAVYIIGNGSNTYQQLDHNGLENQTLGELHTAWRTISDKRYNLRRVRTAIQAIDRHSLRISSHNDYWSFHVRKLKSETETGAYFILIDQDSPKEILSQSLQILCNLWQVQNGFIPLHSCGINHKRDLFIFSGPSGYGKSTIARLSAEIGDTVLDEDQLMIYRRNDGEYSANAWGYGLQSSTSRIRAFFRIQKDKSNKLKPITKTHTARLFADQSFTITGKHLPDEDVNGLFRRIATLARAIPGYELHFTKSPEFWKLIDEQFSD